MFTRFLSMYHVDARVDGSPLQLPPTVSGISGFVDFMNQFSGCTFNSGIYRVHTAETSQAILPHVVDEFPAFRDRIVCFGFDWIGRQFAVDVTRGDEEILMLEADTGDALWIPANFQLFHESEAVDYPDDVFLLNMFNEWQSREPQAQRLSHEQCMGFQVPMFLGGSVDLDNLEITNMQVHWSLTAQLRRGTGGMPLGTTIDDVKIE